MPPAGGRRRLIVFFNPVDLVRLPVLGRHSHPTAGAVPCPERRDPKLPDVFSLRLAANALVVGALTFFFGLALKGWAEADRYDPSACRAAETDLWASLFVLAAALLRLSALAGGQGQAPAPRSGPA